MSAELMMSAVLLYLQYSFAPGSGLLALPSALNVVPPTPVKGWRAPDWARRTRGNSVVVVLPLAI